MEMEIKIKLNRVSLMWEMETFEWISFNTVYKRTVQSFFMLTRKHLHIFKSRSSESLLNLINSKGLAAIAKTHKVNNPRTIFFIFPQIQSIDYLRKYAPNLATRWYCPFLMFSKHPSDFRTHRFPWKTAFLQKIVISHRN